MQHTSTLYSALSNGKAESTIKSMKKIIHNTNSLNWLKLGCRKTLLQYHNTSFRKGGLSPTQKLYGHPVQDKIPAREDKIPAHEGNSLLSGSEAWKKFGNRPRKKPQQSSL